MRARVAEVYWLLPAFGLVLKLSDLVAQEGVHYMQSFCGLLEVQLLYYDHKVGQALQIHECFIQVMY